MDSGSPGLGSPLAMAVTPETVVIPTVTTNGVAAIAAGTTQATFPPPPLPGGSDSAFSADEFRLVEKWLGTKFTFDAACNEKGTNARCAHFASPSRSFLESDVAGETLWCHAPYEQLTAFADHYRTCKNVNRQTLVLYSWPRNGLS